MDRLLIQSYVIEANCKGVSKLLYGGTQEQGVDVKLYGNGATRSRAENKVEFWLLRRSKAAERAALTAGRRSSPLCAGLAVLHVS